MVKTQINFQYLNKLKSILISKNDSINLNKKLGKNITKNIQDNELNNQLVKIRTGNLRNNIKSKIISNQKDFYINIYYDNNKVQYWKKLEFGFNGVETVKQHMRFMSIAWGRPMKNPRDVLIRTHQRKIDFKERRFIRSNLEKNKQLYTQFLNDQYKIIYQNKILKINS